MQPYIIKAVPSAFQRFRWNQGKPNFYQKKQQQTTPPTPNKQTKNMLRVGTTSDALRYAQNLVVNIEMLSASGGLTPDLKP